MEPFSIVTVPRPWTSQPSQAAAAIRGQCSRSRSRKVSRVPSGTAASCSASSVSVSVICSRSSLWSPPSAPARRVERRVVLPVLGGQVLEEISRGSDVLRGEHVDPCPVLAREDDRDGGQPLAALVAHGGVELRQCFLDVLIGHRLHGSSPSSGWFSFRDLPGCRSSLSLDEYAHGATTVVG